MAKFYGIVGFVHEEVDEVNAPGVFVEKPTERPYFGDTINARRDWTSTDTLNDNVTINNRVSIVADEFAYKNSFAMRYVKLRGINWCIKNVDVQYPRLILSLGGVYNGITCESS